MDFKIIWTVRALKEYGDIISYLYENFTKKEIVTFDNKVEQVITNFREMPYRYHPSILDNNLRKAFVTKNVSLVYQIKPRKKAIVIISIWDNRRNPAKLKF